ncbi:MAG: DNA repair protein RecO [Candidatus Curtissbacteria bacterium]|nr:DNA repair protein RecO [Candidatus Curtissbacteria bacterium]
MYQRTEAIVLRRRNFAEADRIVTFYTRDFGKITAIAKGVRRPRSRKAGHLELGNWCKVFVARGRNLDLLTEVELKQSFGIADFTEDKANRIYHLLEIVESLTPEAQRNQRVYFLLLAFLKEIQDKEDFNLISSVFKIKILSSLGFFSTKSLGESKTKDVIAILESENLKTIRDHVNLSADSHLKLMSFLDSIIENLTQTKLKTAKYL